MEQESKMSIVIKGFFSRIVNIITSPEKEWQIIRSENPSKTSLFVYTVLLSLIPAFCIFINNAFVGDESYPEGNPMLGLQLGGYSFLSMIALVYLLAWFTDFRAQAFESNKNFTSSLQLVVYSFTPYWLLGVVFIFGRTLGFIPQIIGLYSIYLIYLGLPILKETNSTKTVGYILNIGIALIVLRMLFQSLSDYSLLLFEKLGL